MSEEIQRLFREEVSRARQIRLDGELVMSSPTRLRLGTALLASLVIMLIALLFTGSYPRVETVKGILVTDLDTTKVVALHPGVITSLPVKDGQLVRTGDILTQVQVDLPYGQGLRSSAETLAATARQYDLALQQVEASKQRQMSVKAGLQSGIRGIGEQLVDLERQIATQRALIASLREMYDRYLPVAMKGFISETEMDRRKQAVLVAQSELARLQQQQAGMREERAKSAAELQQIEAEGLTQSTAARSAVEGFRAQQSQLRATQSYTVVAPQSGIVTALQAEVGRTVDATVPLMTIIPNNATVHAQLFAPTKSIGFIRVGQEVRLLYDAFPYARFGSFPGRVTGLSRTAFDPRQLDVPFRFEEPVYRIDVRPSSQLVRGYGANALLHPGMTLSANVVLERRSFSDWLFEPIKAVRNGLR